MSESPPAPGSPATPGPTDPASTRRPSDASAGLASAGADPDNEPIGGLALRLSDEAATDRLASAIALCLTPGVRIHLSGELGAGKTRLARGLLRALGHRGSVRSPTFTLLEPYSFASFTVYHFDFYRFTGENDWRDAGFDEALDDPTGVVLIEWSERAGGRLPLPDLHLILTVGPADERLVQIHPHSARGRAWLNTLASAGEVIDAAPSLRPGPAPRT